MSRHTKTLTLIATFASLLSPVSAEAPPIVAKDKIVDALGKKPTLTRGISAAAKPAVSIQAILFKFGSDEVDGAQSYEQLKQLGQALSDPRMKDAMVEIQGHTDNVGNSEANQKLSESRARKIVEMLTHLYGVSSENLKAIGKGQSEPAAGTKEQQTDEQRALNRRVVIARIK